MKCKYRGMIGVKYITKFSLLLILIISNLIVTTFASNENAPIVMDGNFQDWNSKPCIADPKHDIKTPASDITDLKFIADNHYLYLYVERVAAEKSESWNLSVIMINGVEGQMRPQNIPGYKAFESPQFDIVCNYDGSNNKNDMLVNVYLDGTKLETTFSASTNGKNIEFRLPLEKIGLGGKNKSISFIVKSGNDEKEIDWVPDGKTIVVTTGPSLWTFSYAILFGFAFFAFAKKVKQQKCLSI